MWLCSEPLEWWNKREVKKNSEKMLLIQRQIYLFQVDYS